MSEPKRYEHRCFECGKVWSNYQPQTRSVIRCARCRSEVETARAIARGTKPAVFQKRGSA